MASKELIRAIENYENYIEKKGIDEEAVNAYMDACRTAYLNENDRKYGMEIANRCKKHICDLIYKSTQGGTFTALEKWSQATRQEVKLINQWYELSKYQSFDSFENYLFYMERDRAYEKRFYAPRRGTLKVVVDDLQKLEDDLLDTYGLSLPSRTGKSTTGIFFLSWVGMRKPMSHNAMGGHSGQLVKRFYRGLDNITSVDDYRFAELFNFYHPTMKKVVERKSSDPAELSINLGKEDEFPTFCCRSIDATWTGAIDVSEDGYLYVDDLVRDREHSMSASRMENTYQEYQNKMLDRMNDGAKKLLVGTLWSVMDPLIREEQENKGNPRALFRRIPALNEYDESNFQYEYKGFSSKYYIDMRSRLDKAEWMAKFQQAPFVREGLTFPVEELRRFKGQTPEGKYRMIAALDPAFGRGDALSMPICKDYGEKQRYIIDWVHDKRTIAFTIPEIVDKIQRHGITRLKIEKNRGGDLFAEKLQEEMDARGIRGCKIELENAPVKMSKEDKISGYSDFVKRHFLFLDFQKDTEFTDCEYYASEQYKRAFDETTLFSAEGKNLHDDAPDAITQLAMMFEGTMTKQAKIMKSPF